jgi:hypothetical protein
LAKKKVFAMGAFLEQLSGGLFLVSDDLHCVGVDASRGLVFDCAESHALCLNSATLQKCGLDAEGLDVRRVVLPRGKNKRKR